MVKKAWKNFSNLNFNCITDNKTFWKVVKLYFSDKSTRNEKITLVEENKVILTVKTAKKFSSCFETIAEVEVEVELKNAEVKSLFKKNSRTNNANYRPVSLLPVIFKVYYRLIY